MWWALWLWAFLMIILFCMAMSANAKPRIKHLELPEDYYKWRRKS